MIIKGVGEITEKDALKKTTILGTLIFGLITAIGAAFSGAGSAKEFWSQVLKGNLFYIMSFAVILILVIIIIFLIYVIWGRIVTLKYIRYKIKKIDENINIKKIMSNLINDYDKLSITIDNFEECITQSLDGEIDNNIRQLYDNYVCDKCLPKYFKEKIKEEIKKELKRIYIPKERVNYWKYWFDEEKVI